jgi:pimeloyl-ACP methyl ester carboxylesterase
VSRRAVYASLLAVPVALVPATRDVSRHFLFRTGRARATATPADAVLETTVARDGATVHALELRGPPGAPVLVHFHNNSETMSGPMAMARALRARGLDVMLVEYRGYGLSQAGGREPDEEGLYRDAEAALDMLAARGVGPDRVVLSGTSLGTGVAAEMARRGRGAALVLISPYTSIPDLVTDRVPFAPSRLLVADRFETLQKAPAIDVPTLVIHGDADDVVPFWMGRRVASAIGGARFVRVAGGRHGDGDLFARDGDRLVAEVVRVAALATARRLP